MSNQRYQLAKKIARGGMAEIFLARQIGEDGFQRLCAIKRILPHYAQDAEFVEMFRDEAHICKSLLHANIVRVEGFEEVDGSYAIIMEFVNGGDLRTLLAACEKQNKRLSIAAACYIIAEAARGLHFAHTKIDEITNRPLEIVHRDISPQNILLSFAGEVKVTDFGIAQSENKITETQPGIVKGKYAYMSPEQITAGSIDARTDVFALSIVLWEMLAMKRLFQGENEVQTINLVRDCRIPLRLRSVNAKVSENLEALVLKGLAKEKKQRFSSAAAFEKSLRKYLNQNHPDFNPSDLAETMKKVLSKKNADMQHEIKKVFTENKKPPSKQSKHAGQAKNAEETQGDRLVSQDRRKQSRIKEAISSNMVADPPAISMAPRSTATKARAKAIPIRNPQAKGGYGRSHMTTLNRGGTRRTVAHGGTSRSIPRGRNATRQNTRGSPKSYALLAFASLFLICFMGWYQFVHKALKPSVELMSTPSRVKVIIDGKKMNNGKYTNSPIHIFGLKPGKHSIKVMREGFKSEVEIIEVKKGKTVVVDTIILKKDSKSSPTKVYVAKGEKNVKIDVNNGLEVGSTPMSIQHLIFGQEATLKVYLDQEEKRFFTCRFVPRAFDWQRPFRVKIDVKSKSCMSGLK